MLCHVELCDVRNISGFLWLCSGYKPQFWDLLRLSLDSLIFQILFLLSSYGSFRSHIYLHDVFMVQMTTLKFVIICKGWCFQLHAVVTKLQEIKWCHFLYFRGSLLLIFYFLISNAAGLMLTMVLLIIILGVGSFCCS